MILIDFCVFLVERPGLLLRIRCVTSFTGLLGSNIPVVKMLPRPISAIESDKFVVRSQLLFQVTGDLQKYHVGECVWRT